MRCLVTGGAGFIGYNVIKLLEQQDHVCFNIDTKTDYGFIPQDELKYLHRARMQQTKSDAINLDIRNVDCVKSYVSIFGIDTIIHLASFPRQKVVSQMPSVASEVMCTGLVSLLEAAAHAKIKRFVYVSSSMVYGDFKNDVTEDAVCSPKGQYGIMKYMGEKLVEDYARRHGFEYTIIRPSAVYGEYDVNDRVVSKFLLNAMRGEALYIKGAEEILDFTHVSDTANGIVLATSADIAANKIYNITRSSERIYTLLSAAKLAIRIAKNGSVAIRERDADFPSRGRLSINRARKELGYEPRVDIEDGFQRYYNWFKESEFWKKKV